MDGTITLKKLINMTIMTITKFHVHFTEMDTAQWKQEVCNLRDKLIAQKPNAFPPTYGDFNILYLARAEDPCPLRPIAAFQCPVYKAGQQVDGGGVPQRFFGMGAAGLDAHTKP